MQEQIVHVVGQGDLIAKALAETAESEQGQSNEIKYKHIKSA